MKNIVKLTSLATDDGSGGVATNDLKFNEQERQVA